jgi:predicted DNA-binding transcriptional regulator AlpA
VDRMPNLITHQVRGTGDRWEQPRLLVDRLLNQREVLERLPFGRTKLKRLVKEGVCPRPVRIGARAWAWPETVIDALVARLTAGEGVAHD